MISIIIPAHNEANVIERCLRALTDGAAPGELEVIVACNGCSDGTADLVRAFGEPVRVVETDEASKIAALNLGDQAARGFPRCYIDADVEVTLDAVRQVAGVIERGEALAAAPAMRVDLSESSWLVRAYYHVWLSRPFHADGMLGGGFYAVGEEGRARFDAFPRIIADDEFVRSLFTVDERATPDDCTFTIRAPRTVFGLIKVKSRSRLGLYELRRRFPDMIANSKAKATPKQARAVHSPAEAVYSLVYLALNLITRARARWQLRSIETYQWERDNSSREPARA